MKAKPARGFYKLIISMNPQKADSRLIGTSGAEVSLSNFAGEGEVGQHVAIFTGLQ